MEIEVIYKAKDGKLFNDPYKCREYEEQLGTESGTVARARIDLKALGEDKYVFGMLKVRNNGANKYYTYVTRCLDDQLEDYVNVDDLDVDKRWMRSTISDVLRDMESFYDDDLCEYEFLYCEHWEFNKHPFGCIRANNQKLWTEMKEAETAAEKKKDHGV